MGFSCYKIHILKRSNNLEEEVTIVNKHTDAIHILILEIVKLKDNLLLLGSKETLIIKEHIESLEKTVVFLIETSNEQGKSL